MPALVAVLSSLALFGFSCGSDQTSSNPASAPPVTPPPSEESAAASIEPTEGFVPVEVEGVTTTPAVVLSHAQSGRYLTIHLDANVAKAIAAALTPDKSNSGSPHQLVRSIIHALDAELVHAEIRWGGRAFVATLVLRDGDRVHRIRSRSSDAIAVALRAGVDIYVADADLDSEGTRLNATPATTLPACDQLLTGVMGCAQLSPNVAEQVLLRGQIESWIKQMVAKGPLIARDGCIITVLDLARRAGGQACMASVDPSQISDAARVLARLDEHPVVFQPRLVQVSGNAALAGTGFFARAPDQSVVAITSAHFFDFDGEALAEAVWLDVSSRRPVATMTRSRGRPGRAGSTDPMDLRSDYMLLIPDEAPTSVSVLTLDVRDTPEVGERIWFPSKSLEPSERGFSWMSGEVKEAAPTHLLIALDDETRLQSKSGSPAISQVTGAVVGILYGNQDGLLMFTPAHAIVEALARAEGRPALRDVVGKPQRRPRR
ncbi:bifunctional nuclease family protein [Haliangium sp.]|uniref:bifunctional nuclease family protein n=1 Tax=Haliangium sp. TaxID=2663208 RepID=UPI003D0F8EAC